MNESELYDNNSKVSKTFKVGMIMLGASVTTLIIGAILGFTGALIRVGVPIMVISTILIIISTIIMSFGQYSGSNKQNTTLVQRKSIDDYIRDDNRVIKVNRSNNENYYKRDRDIEYIEDLEERLKQKRC